MYVNQNQHKAYNKSFKRMQLTGSVIKSFRRKAGISQHDLAERVKDVGAPYGISVTPSTISCYERNICQPKMEITWALCQVMRLDTTSFHGYKKP